MDNNVPFSTKPAKSKECRSNTDCSTNISYVRLEADGLKLIKNGKFKNYESKQDYNRPQTWKDANFPWNRR